MSRFWHRDREYAQETLLEELATLDFKPSCLREMLRDSPEYPAYGALAERVLAFENYLLGTLPSA